MDKLTNAEFNRLADLLSIHGNVVSRWTLAMNRRPWWRFGNRTADEAKCMAEHSAVVQEIVNFCQEMKGQGQ